MKVMMKKPKVTVIVVNYNSKTKWNIIGSCIRGILSLNYRPLEIIIVDNGSTDGSFEVISQLINEVKQSPDFAVRIIRLSKNYGFAVANIIAYKLRDPLSKYVALINNDVYPEPDSLAQLVEFLEKSEKIAGIQGIILSWNGSYILTYGGFLTDHGGVSGGIAAFMESNIIKKLRPIATAYIDGAYSVYNVKALKKAGGLFMPYFFMWGDDYELGIRLWRSGYILVAVPIIAGRHYAGASTKIDNGTSLFESPKLPYIYEYWAWVSNIAVITILYGYPYPLQLLKRVPIIFIVSALKKSKAILRGFIDGVTLGIKLRRKFLNLMPWLLSLREPRLTSHFFHELSLMIRLYLKYGYKASKVYYVLIARALGRKYLKKAET
jgi:GT2 family glycosyltransferase